jgi:hypothetical protein
LTAWILLPAALLLFSRSKRDLYLLPIFPAVSLVVAGWLERLVDGKSLRRIFLVLLCALAVTTPVGALLLAGTSGASPVLATMVLVAHFYGVAAWLRTYRRSRQPVFTALCLLVLATSTWGSLYHAMRSPNECLAELGGVLRDLEGGGAKVLGYKLVEREIAAVAWQLKHPFDRTDDVRRILDGSREPGAGKARRVIVAAAEDLETLRAASGGEALEGFQVLFGQPARRRLLQVLTRG